MSQRHVYALACRCPMNPRADTLRKVVSFGFTAPKGNYSRIYSSAPSPFPLYLCECWDIRLIWHWEDIFITLMQHIIITTYIKIKNLEKRKVMIKIVGHKLRFFIIFFFLQQKLLMPKIWIVLTSVFSLSRGIS